jgi:hypothetical protein
MIFKTDFLDLACRPGSVGRGDCQHGWLDLVRPLFVGKTVLDVGAGISTTKARLPGAIVTTQEPCAECGADLQCDIGQVEGKWDALICNDVIEHVKEYGRFVFHLARLTRQYLFLTTPGAEVTGNTSPFHFHEFMPWELVNLLEAAGFELDRAWGQRWAGPAEYKGSKPANLLTGVVELKRDDLLEYRFIHPIAVLMTVT